MKVDHGDSVSRHDVHGMIASALQSNFEHTKEAIISIAKLMVADAVEKCRAQRRPGQGDVGFFGGSQAFH